MARITLATWLENNKPALPEREHYGQRATIDNILVWWNMRVAQEKHSERVSHSNGAGNARFWQMARETDISLQTAETWERDIQHFYFATCKWIAESSTNGGFENVLKYTLDGKRLLKKHSGS